MIRVSVKYCTEKMFKYREYEFCCYGNDYMTTGLLAEDGTVSYPSPDEVRRRGRHLHALVDEMIEESVRSVETMTALSAKRAEGGKRRNGS